MVISVVFDVSEHLDNFLGEGATLNEIIFTYYVGFIPFYMMLLSPLINFLAVIFFYGQNGQPNRNCTHLNKQGKFLSIFKALCNLFNAYIYSIITGQFVPFALYK